MQNLPKQTNKQTNQIVFIRETQIKITLRYRFAPIKMAVLQKTQNTTMTDEDVEELEPSCTPTPEEGKIEQPRRRQSSSP